MPDDAPPPASSGISPLNRLAQAVRLGADRLGIETDAALVLAVSGGPDSMALLHGCARLVETDARQWRLTVAHLDHALRADSAEDATFVTDAAAGLGLPAEMRRTDVSGLARAEGRSMEDAGRAARYRFLEEVAQGAGDRALIATAHTADDAAETVLLNLVRGSGLAGARGMPARRGRVVRPLLGERRAALRSALDAAGIAYRLDPTNDDPAHLRNRVRHELLPAVEALRSGAVQALARFARLAADDDALLDAFAAAEMARRRGADGALDWHDPPDRALGRRILRLVIGNPAISAERIEAVLDAAEGPRGGLGIELGEGRTATVRSRRIWLE